MALGEPAKADDDARAPAVEVVGTGGAARSAHFRCVYTFGPPAPGQGASTSGHYRVEGALVGENGSQP